ncbi:MAG TPA: hypothetical protein VFS49_03250, partial [Croceibacterium sp.]|nr:hypothetical protein [Croceibacterium sp.]
VDLNLRDGFTGPYLGERLNEAGIKVVFVTANTGLLSERNAMRSPVLEKPLEQSVLANVLKPIMDQVRG